MRRPAYWTTKIQLQLFERIQQYLKDNGVSRSRFAEQLGVSRAYVSQVLNGNFDHKLSKLVKLSLAMGLVPEIRFVPIALKIAQTKEAAAQKVAPDTYADVRVSIQVAIAHQTIVPKAPQRQKLIANPMARVQVPTRERMTAEIHTEAA